MRLIWVRTKAEFFLREGLDRLLVICPSGTEEKTQAFQYPNLNALPFLSLSHVSPALRIPSRNRSINSGV
jgi:hypothetical protein